MRFPLPAAVRCIADARRTLQKHYKDSGLTFTPDGKLVGDLGEAVAAEMFDLKLDPQGEVDGFAEGGTLPVQVKATGRKNGSVYFRSVQERRHRGIWLIVLLFDWDQAEVELIYSGSEDDIRPDKDKTDGKQRPVSLANLRRRQQRNGLPISSQFLQLYPPK